ncbi:hypothetical protein F5Y01DRAFT_318127 [Xylaria sp. FL0043]|nr:hypothetical protein F5Y01DRAFT_318127 [Xylaria sp. FL0043]
MQIKLAVLLSLAIGAIASPIVEISQRDPPKITGPKPYKIFNREREEKRDNPKITGPRPYKIFNREENEEKRETEIYKIFNVDSEKRDSTTITGPRPYKIFNTENGEK